MDRADELVQIAEQQLADAEETDRLDPSDANQRRIVKAWSVVRSARDRAQDAAQADRSDSGRRSRGDGRL